MGGWRRYTTASAALWSKDIQEKGTYTLVVQVGSSITRSHNQLSIRADRRTATIKIPTN
jgi:hypothetical protein